MIYRYFKKPCVGLRSNEIFKPQTRIEMPIDYRKYAKNWKTEIRPAILLRAGHCCEFCGVKNYLVGYRDKKGFFYDIQFIMDELDNNGRDLFEDKLKNCYDKKGFPNAPIRIVLTIAHLDQNIENNDYQNLRALCQRCHLGHDKLFNFQKTRDTVRRKKGLLQIPF